MAVLPMIEGCNLKKSFGGQVILENASFVVPDGALVGLCGKSGIGKSTLAKLLCGVLAPEDGELRLDGELLCSPTRPYDRQRGLRIQMAYQQPYAALDSRQRLRAGFYELIRYHKLAPNRAAADDLISGLLSQVGLTPELLNHLPHQISGGEAQRIAIARCLLFRPRLLILDEATSMLDVSTQANVLGLVRRSMEETGGSVLLISHDAALVDAVCSKIYRFENRHLKEELK